MLAIHEHTNDNYNGVEDDAVAEIDQWGLLSFIKETATYSIFYGVF